MQSNHDRKQLRLLAILLIIGVSFFVGYSVGVDKQSSYISSIPGLSESMPENVDFSPFWKAWQVLEEKYVPPTATTTNEIADQEKIWGAIEGLTWSLGDPYTVFFPPEDAESFEEEISGNFEGVGIEIGIQDDILTVIAPLKGTPAYRAGIKAGDKILEIDGTQTSSLSIDDAIDLIRGERGTKVTLTVSREGNDDVLRIDVARDVIDIPTIDTQTIGTDIFVIRLYNFSALSTQSFRDALREFVQSDRSRLILDLRGNPGGYLEAAVDMASWFLPAGKVVVREEANVNEKERTLRSKGYNIFSDELEMVVLVDGGSASASEILAGALQEHAVATVIGETTFGKGSVQELVSITPYTSLKVTVARWLTPNGRSISNGGLEPDITSNLDIDAFLAGNDTQLQRAVDFLREEK